MAIFKVFLLSFGMITTAYGQGKLVPPTFKINDLELREFIAGVKKAVESKDREFIINHLSPQIQNSFGGDGGIEEFKQYWNWSSNETSFWELMNKILELGGGEYNGGNRYSMPYVFSDWPGHEKYNAFEYMAITGTHVNVRDKPSLESSKVLGQLNYDIVQVDYEKSYPPFDEPKIDNVSYVGDKLWYYIETLDVQLEGYVYWDYIWSPIGYRIGFHKMDGRWMITFLLAGD